MKKTSKTLVFIGLIALLATVFPQSLIAAGSPFVMTNSATGISQNSATLNGQITPNGGDTYEWFEYGTTSSFGSTTNHLFVGSGTDSVPASATLQNFLLSNTTYYFRSVAQNQYGISYGSMLTFTTSNQGGFGSIPAVQTMNATGVWNAGANLNAQINPQGNGTTYWFEYGTSPSFGYTTGTQFLNTSFGAQNVTISVSNLLNNSTYYFRAVAQNQYGTAYGTVFNFTTNQNGTIQPSVSTLAATSVTDTSTVLNMQVTTQGSNTYVWFEYGTNASILGYTTNTSFLPNISGMITPYSQSIANLIPGTTYYYRAVARNDSGTSYGQVLSFYTTGNQGGIGQVSYAITNSATSIGEQSGVLNGSANNVTGGATAWFEYGVTTALGNRSTTLTPFSSNYLSNFSFLANGLAPRTTYYFRAVVQTPYGTSYGSILSFRTHGTVSGGGTTSGGLGSTTGGVACLALDSATAQDAGDVSHIAYTVTYHNTCSASLTNAVLKVAFPPEADIILANSFTSREGNTITYSLGTLLAGSQSSVLLKGTVRNGVGSGALLTFSATMTFRDPQGNDQSLSTYATGVASGTVSNTNSSGSGSIFGASVLGAFKVILSSWIVQIILIILVAFLIYVIFLKSKETA